MQTAKTFSSDSPAPMLQRVAPQSAAAAARRAKRVAALEQLAPQLEALSHDTKQAGLYLIGYFLDMALFEVKREQDVFAQQKTSSA